MFIINAVMKNRGTEVLMTELLPFSRTVKSHRCLHSQEDVQQNVNR